MWCIPETRFVPKSGWYNEPLEPPSFGPTSFSCYSETMGRGHDWNVNMPSWFLVLTTAIAPLLWLRMFRRQTRTAGHCPSCGYDLRATPNRCPECGTSTHSA